MKSIPTLELHEGKPYPAPVKCIREILVAHKFLPVEYSEEKQLGIAQASVFKERRGVIDFYPMATPCPKGKAYLLFNVNSALGVYGIIYPAASSGNLLAHSAGCLPHTLRLY